MEAVFAGPDDRVAAMAEACRTGPHGARVDDILAHEASEAALAASGVAGPFAVLPTL